MTLLVTGAMGHVGLEVVKHALGAGDTVVAQYRSTFRADEVRGLTDNVTWVACDLADQKAG